MYACERKCWAFTIGKYIFRLFFSNICIGDDQQWNVLMEIRVVKLPWSQTVPVSPVDQKVWRWVKVFTHRVFYVFSIRIEDATSGRAALQPGTTFSSLQRGSPDGQAAVTSNTGSIVLGKECWSWSGFTSERTELLSKSKSLAQRQLEPYVVLQKSGSPNNLHGSVLFLKAWMMSQRDHFQL